MVVALAAIFLFFRLTGAAAFTGSIPAAEPITPELRARARISAGEVARQIRAKFPGSITEVALEAEDGFLVYEVESTGANGARYEFLVDAGTGELLEQKVKPPKRRPGGKHD